MRWLGSLSLKGAIVLGMALGILLPVLVVGPVPTLDTYQRELNARITSLLKQYGTMLAQSMSTPIWHVDQPAAKSFVNSLMSNPDVISVRVEGASLGPFIFIEKPAPPIGTLVQ